MPIITITPQYVGPFDMVLLGWTIELPRESRWTPLEFVQSTEEFDPWWAFMFSTLNRRAGLPVWYASEVRTAGSEF